MTTNILENWFQKIWVDGDLEAVDALFAPDTLASGMMEFEVGPEDFKALVPAFLAHVEDVTFNLDRHVEADNWHWAHVSVHCRSQATGQPVHVTGQIMCRVRDGVIREAYNHFDFIGFFEQLGLLPENTMALCLSGEGVS